MSRGFVISAQSTVNTNYVRCAETLALSMKKVMPNCDITLISNDESMCSAFDKVVELPLGDLAPSSDWKLINDYQVYQASPYDETIKLEADMFIPRSIEHWFDVLQVQDVAVCNRIRNFKGEISNSRAYRRFIDDNNLPDCYNAITYFKKSAIAEQFFAIVKDVFVNWNEYKAILKCNPDEAVTTDWAYALASHIIGIEKTTINFDEFSMTHMKQFINDLPTENWTDTLVYEIFQDSLRINTNPQLYPLHYHVKNFSDTIRSALKWNK